MKIGKKILIGIALFILIFILSFQFIVKKIAEAKGAEILERELTIEDISLGLFSGDFEIEGLKISNKDKSDVFVALSRLNISIDLGEIIFGDKIHITSLSLDNSEINIWKNDTLFNFSDLLERNEPANSKDTPSRNRVLAIDILKINNAKISYSDQTLNTRFDLENLNILMANFNTNENLVNLKLNSKINNEASLDLIYRLNMNSGIYEGEIDLNDFYLDGIKGYLSNAMNISEINGALDFKGVFIGNLETMGLQLNNSVVDLEKFILVDSMGNTAMAFPKTTIAIHSFDLLKEQFEFEKINVLAPTLEYVMLDTVNNNFSHIFRLDEKVGNEIDTLAIDSVETIVFDTIGRDTSVKEEIYYFVKNFLLDNANVYYKDQSLTIPFQFDIGNLTTSIDSIWPNQNVNPINITANLCDSGIFKMNILYYPKKRDDFGLNLDIDKMEMASLSPYLYEYIGHKTLSGHLEMHSKNTVISNKLKGENKIIIHELFLNNKEKKEGIVNLPIKLALRVLRNLKNKIKLNVPIKGDFSDPEFKIKKLLVTTLLNIVSKAAATPYNGVTKVFTRNNVDDIGWKSNSILTDLNNYERQLIDQFLYQYKKDKKVKINLNIFKPNGTAKTKISNEIASRNQYFKDWRITEKENINKVDLTMIFSYKNTKGKMLNDEEIKKLTEAKVSKILNYTSLHGISKETVIVNYLNIESSSPFQVTIPIY